MVMGPVQLIVLGFSQPDFQDEIIAELEQLCESEEVRVIDALVVYRDVQGDLEVEQLSDFSTAVQDPGSKIKALIGLSTEDDIGLVGARIVVDEGIRMPLDADAWNVLAQITDDSAAGLLLIEHRWAVPLRDASVRAGGFRLADGFVSPFDLMEIGLVTPKEATELYSIENATVAR